MVIALETARRVAGEVTDPELPVLTLADLGVLRDVTMDDDGAVTVTLTPTYTGCPALHMMAADVEQALRREGAEQVTVRTVLAPAWTTDWISEDGRRKLTEYGIAPPGPARCGGAVRVELSVRCPRCGSPDTRLLSRFSSTACKALRSCRACGEPFEHVKPL